MYCVYCCSKWVQTIVRKYLSYWIQARRLTCPFWIMMCLLNYLVGDCNWTCSTVFILKIRGYYCITNAQKGTRHSGRHLSYFHHFSCNLCIWHLWTMFTCSLVSKIICLHHFFMCTLSCFRGEHARWTCFCAGLSSWIQEIHIAARLWAGA